MDVTIRLLVGNSRTPFELFVSLSPNTAERIIPAEFLWKLSKETEETAPLTFEAMDLHISPIKSGTLNNFAPLS
uniref:Uncharacterized protein n=1 Tax=Lepeophtheirus salmonis TaxID=72036 RepID=A0A0K2VEA7_LEPSM